MRMIVVAGICAVLLTGCGILDGSDTWEGQQSSAPSQPMASAQAPLPATMIGQASLTGQAAKDDATCRSYGTYPGTTPYVQCRLGLKKMAEERADEESPLAALFGN